MRLSLHLASNIAPKAGRVTGRGVTCAAVLLLLLTLGSSCSSAERGPESARAKWIGTWESRRAPGVRGSLSCWLPRPIAQDREFQVVVIVTYDNPGYLLPNGPVEMHLVGRSDTGGKMAGVGIRRRGQGPVLRSLSLTGGRIGTNQRINYTTEASATSTELSGTYTSENPSDAGTFTIRKK